MNEEVKKEGTKERDKRAKKHDVKISHGDYLSLTAYCKATPDTSIPKIINKLVKDFLSQDDVQKIVKANSQVEKKKELLKKKRDEIAKLEAELAELEKGDNEAE